MTVDRLDGRLFSASEAARLGTLAAPLALTALVNMGMSLTDVVMMGWLGPAALAAGAVASDFYSIVFYLAVGVVSAIAPVISHARGARDLRTVRRATQQGLWAATIVSVPGMILIWYTDALLALIGVKPAIVDNIAPYARWMSLTFLFMTGVGVWRNFLSAHHISKVIFYATALALPLNALANYVLMFGHFGLPTYGLAGAGMASAIVACFLFFILLAYIAIHPKLRRYRLWMGIGRPDLPMLREVFRIGLPIGVSNVSELGIFLFSTVIMGMVSVEALAAHAIALRAAGVVYALPLGLSQAATVRVGYGVGAQNTELTGRAWRTSLWLAAVGGLVTAAILVSANQLIPQLFLANGGDQVLEQAAWLLILLAVLQPFDSIGSVSAGVLRGFKDTRVPMLFALFGYWGFAFPLILTLVFVANQGAAGLWMGLVAGCSVVGGFNLSRLFSQQRTLGFKPLVTSTQSC